MNATTSAMQAGADHIELQPQTLRPAADYSHVTSRELARELSEQGLLFEVTLFPEEFGGTREPANLLYVPAGIPEIKDLVTEALLALRREGLMDRLAFEVEYKGDSFVPCRIRVCATHSARSRTFEPQIGIW